MDTIISLRAERARLMTELDHAVDRFQLCRSYATEREMQRLSTLINRIDLRLIGST